MPAPTVQPHASPCPFGLWSRGRCVRECWGTERIVGSDRYVAVHPCAAAFAIDERTAQRIDEKADTAGQTREHARRHLAIRADNFCRGLHAGVGAVGVEVAGVGLKAHDPARRYLPVVAKLKTGKECGRVDLVAEYRRPVRFGECRRAGSCASAAAEIEPRPSPDRQRWRKRQVGRGGQRRRHQGRGDQRRSQEISVARVHGSHRKRMGGQGPVYTQPNADRWY